MDIDEKCLEVWGANFASQQEVMSLMTERKADSYYIFNVDNVSV